MRARFAAVCLALEAFLVFFATLVATGLSDLPRSTVWAAGGALSVACLLAAGLVRRPWGTALGWVLQVLVVATGFWVPAMFGLGLLFVAMWVWLLTIGGRIDRDRAAWAAQGDG
ncbi:DUF4233 domain-containing protein [Thalassiella azotivora]